MFNLYYVNNKKKSDVKGLWTENKKTYSVDNIHIKAYRHRKSLNNDIKKLFDKGEKCVLYSYVDNDKFYENDFIGIIENENGEKVILNNRLFFRRDKLSIKEIKSLLSKYGGLTIHKRDKGFFIEIYY